MPHTEYTNYEDEIETLIVSTWVNQPDMPNSTKMILSFAPVTEEDGSGGFFWWRRTGKNLEDVIAEARVHVRGGLHVVRFLYLDPGPETDYDAITEIFENRIEEIEDTAYAMVTYIPEGTDESRVPSGESAEYVR